MKKKYWFGCWHCSQFLVVRPKGHFFQHSWMHVSAWTLALPMSLLPLSPWLEFTDSLHSNRGLLDEEPGKDTTSMDLHTLQRKAGTTDDCHKHIYLVQKQNHSTVKPKAVCTCSRSGAAWVRTEQTGFIWDLWKLMCVLTQGLAAPFLGFQQVCNAYIAVSNAGNW